MVPYLSTLWVCQKLSSTHQSNSVLFDRRLPNLRTLDRRANSFLPILAKNLPGHAIHPDSLCTSLLMFLDGGICWIAFIFLGSTSRPCSETMNPKHFLSDTLLGVHPYSYLSYLLKGLQYVYWQGFHLLELEYYIVHIHFYILAYLVSKHFTYHLLEFCLCILELEWHPCVKKMPFFVTKTVFSIPRASWGYGDTFYQRTLCLATTSTTWLIQGSMNGFFGNACNLVCL